MKDIGRQAILDAARRAGLQATLLPVPSLPLGTNEVTLLDLTTGYVTFANGGKRCEALHGSGNPAAERRSPVRRDQKTRSRTQTVPPEKIAELNTMLSRSW